MKIKNKTIWEEMFKVNITKEKEYDPDINIWDIVFYDRYYGGSKS